MAITFAVLPARRHALLTGAGEVTMAQMMAAVQALAEDPAFDPAYTVLFDLRAVRYTAELADGEALAALLRQRKTQFKNRFAVVVDESLQILATLYCLMANLAGFEPIRCFTDLAQAEAWCAETRAP